MRIATLSKFVLAATCLASALPVLADTVPYANTGHIAATTPMYASSNDGVGVSLFFYGSDASYTDQISLMDINTGYKSDWMMANHASTPGQTVTVGQGSIHQGDQIVFLINSPEGTFASDPMFSDDNDNHVFVTPFAGGVVQGASIPSGLFLGFEDKKASDTDWDYNDLQVVSRGVSVTPEPGSIALFGTGLLGLAGAVRRRLA